MWLSLVVLSTVLAADKPKLAVLDWNPEAARHYADIRHTLLKTGRQLGANDLFIAAHARSLGATVVTNNVKDFGRVRGLKVENWTI